MKRVINYLKKKWKYSKLGKWIKRKLRGEYVQLVIVGHFNAYYNGKRMMDRKIYPQTIKLWYRRKDSRLAGNPSHE